MASKLGCSLSSLSLRIRLVVPLGCHASLACFALSRASLVHPALARFQVNSSHFDVIPVWCVLVSVVTIPNFAMRYVSRYLGHDAIRIAILVYLVRQCLDLQFVYHGNAICLGALYSVTTIGAECSGR